MLNDTAKKLRRTSDSMDGLLLEKPTVTQVVKQFPSFYETQKFITVHTRPVPTLKVKQSHYRPGVAQRVPGS
jgi:hypothetical protein